MASPSPSQRTTWPWRVSDLRGLAQLGVDGVLGVTGIVEQLHATIAKRVLPLSAERPRETRGLTGLVYGAVKGTTRLVGAGLNKGLGLIDADPWGHATNPGREAAVAALNGVFGDHLAVTGNPLGIPMSLRVGGRALRLDAPLADALPEAGSRIVVLVHGLCMNDLQWRRHGHDHGEMLARQSGYTAVYLHYNSGLHVPDNGARFDQLLDALVRQWPVPVEEIAIVGHSMGGLVARSACHAAEARGASWRQRLKRLACLGTPHHGAPLERGGHLVDMALGVSPYAAPFAKLGKARSAGITDLRYGNVHEDDARGPARHEQARDDRHPVPLPKGVDVFFVAGRRADAKAKRQPRPAGDGLVPVRSALGEHEAAALRLSVPAARQLVVSGANHFDLLDDDEVAERLLKWLS